MKRALIDPLIFAAPVDTATRDELEAYLDRLLLLEDLEKSECIALALSAQAIEALTKADAYPIVQRYSKDVFPQRADVLRVVFGITERLPFVEDLVGFSDLLVSDASCNPPPVGEDWHPALADHFHYLTASIAVSDATGNAPLLRLIVSNPDVEHQQCRASGTVLDVDWSTVHESLPAALALPLPFSIDLLVARNAAGVANCTDLPLKLWIEARSYAGALRVFLHQMSATKGAEGWPVREFKWAFGSQFERTLQHHGFGHERQKVEALLRACAEVILVRESPKSHALRPNKSGGSGQVVRASDGAKAVRHNIGYEYHLHYWETSDGPEFAAVVVHNDYSIPI